MKKLSILLTILAGCGQNQTTSSGTLNIVLDTQESTIPFSKLMDLPLAVPESVTVYNDVTYVANIGGSPTESSGKGFITQIKNNNASNLFVGLLDDPKGFAFLDDDTIIISDHPNVKLLKVSTGEVIASVVLNPGFLNDLVLVNSSTALLSDTGKGLVYKVSINATKDQLSVATVSGISENGINGLSWDNENKTLYFVTSTFGGDATRGHIFEAKLNNNYTSATRVSRWDTSQIGVGGLDGLVLNNGKLILSDWGVDTSSIYIYDVSDRSLFATINGDITGVADITLDNNMLYMPEFLKDQVSVVDLSPYL
ncbi:MAG: hypothetical protein ACRC0X_04790 [Brevinema sp.]